MPVQRRQIVRQDADRDSRAVGSPCATHDPDRSRCGSCCNSISLLYTILEVYILTSFALVGQQLRLCDWYQV